MLHTCRPNTRVKLCILPTRLAYGFLSLLSVCAQLRGDPIALANPLEVTPGIRGAVELTFQTEGGKYYQVDISTDLVHWDPEGYAVKGTGGQISVLVSTRNLSRAYFRLRDDGNANFTAPAGPAGPPGPPGPAGGPPGPQGPPGKDADITNETVNAAILSNPVATLAALGATVHLTSADAAAERTRLGLGTAAAANILPIVQSEIIDDAHEVYADGDPAQLKGWTGAGTVSCDGHEIIMTTTAPNVFQSFVCEREFNLSNGSLVFEMMEDSKLSQINFFVQCGPRSSSREIYASESMVGIDTGVWDTYVLALPYFNPQTVTASDIAQGCHRIRMDIKSNAAGNTTLKIRNVRVERGDGIGRVCFQFDDGMIHDYNTARPILESRGYKGDCAIIPARVGTTNFMSLAQIQELYASGWDMLGHHDSPATLLSLADQVTYHKSIKSYLLDNGLTRGADHFVYPGGIRTQQGDYIASRFWKTRRTIGGRTQLASMGALNPSWIPNYYCTSNINLSDWKAKMNRVATNGGTVLLVFHGITDSPTKSEDMSVAKFTEMVDYVKALGLVDTRYHEMFNTRTVPKLMK